MKQELEKKVGHKQSKIEAKLSLIDRTKHSVFSQIDSFFNKIIDIAESRKQQLKNEYLQIEAKERSHFAKSLEKVGCDSGDLS